MLADKQLDMECADAININQENLKKILDDYQHDKIYINEKFKSLKDKKLII